MESPTKQLHEVNVPFATKLLVPMPHGSRILGAEIRDSELCLWVESNPNNPAEPRELRSYLIYGSFLSADTHRFIAVVDDCGLKYSLYEIIQ